MVHYKFTYFNCKGSGEIVRLVFALAGQEFEDVRVEFSDFPVIKPTTPFGKLPILEEDGKVMGQRAKGHCNTMARYLARKFGLAGKTEWEEAQGDAIVDQVYDAEIETEKFFTIALGFGEGDLSKLKAEVLEPALKKHLPFLANALKSNAYFVGENATWTDLVVASYVEIIREHAEDLLKGFPTLKEHEKRIFSIPNVKDWVEKRPKTTF